MRQAALLIALPLIASPLTAQLERPQDWRVRFDRPGPPDSAVYLVTMEPGWHITSGPSGILYNPSQVAHGEYRVKSEIYLFPGERREGFGVFIGGKNLAEQEQSYVYFLLRKDGRYMIKHRNGAQTPTIVPWTVHEAIVPQSGEENAKNFLEVAVGTEKLDFYVNGEIVKSLPRGDLDTDGVVGLRVNHNLNLHVTSLTVEQNEASQ
ncbi:MAG: hypothetical protein P8X82_03620 [Gemmatimonadales bacterium]